MKPALLIIDVQKEFYKPGGQTAESLKEAVEYINAAIDLFREKDLPIFCIQHIDEKDKLIPGEQGFEVPDEMNIISSDTRIHKTYGNAFTKTTLESKIREQGIDTLIITGFCAEYCVLSTYRGAEDLDLTPILLRGALASSNLENIKFVESINEIISYEALKKVLE